MRKITATKIKKWFQENGHTPRHDIKGLVYATNQINKEVQTDPFNVFLLVVANQPMEHTHSYGFHTRHGRYIIESFKEYYNQYINGVV